MVVSADRARRFPLNVRGTYLVLTEASASDLRAFWQISGDDLIPVVSGFARGGVRPLPVLRLRRLDGGGAGLVREIALRLTGPSGQGEHLFSVDAKPARYDVELGVSDGAGGWIMLARSNALDHAARVDVRLEPIKPRTPGPQPVRLDAAVGDTGPTHAERSHAGRNQSSRNQAGEIDSGGNKAGEGDTSPPVGSNSGGAAPVGIASAGIESFGRVSMPMGVVEAPLGRHLEPPGPTDPGGLSEFDDAALTRAADEPASAEPLVTGYAASARPAASPSAPLVYGQPSPRPGELMIEAELRVNGCAAPGAEIDLFGYPYRVGPGGRFQFIIRVDDPELIARAFALHPPTLPDRSKDD